MLKILTCTLVLALTSSPAAAGIHPNGMRMQGPTGALAKCRAMGYRPGPLFDACVRAVRADFCGDGEAHTIQGVTVDFYDQSGIQYPATEWPFEAGWNAHGAVCVSERVALAGRRAGASFDQCVRDLPVCFGPFPAGALVATRTR